jgi:hypothetical protein
MERRPMQKQRATEIFEQCKKQSGYGPWSDQLQKVMAPDEYAEVKRIWLNKMPGFSSLAGTFCDIKNGFLVCDDNRPIAETFKK